MNEGWRATTGQRRERKKKEKRKRGEKKEKKKREKKVKRNEAKIGVTSESVQALRDKVNKSAGQLHDIG